ncbi:ABC transporter substrate-binding protein [Kutzneria sp. NPDC052558]|uniref:ABC transporter substrate-binding protein n=1 Tax=Kutzneria sp. NPDC052558 TaxID=3364121 RepID=UPI0037C6AD67
MARRHGTHSPTSRRPSALLAATAAVALLTGGCSLLNGSGPQDTAAAGTAVSVEKPTIRIGIIANIDFAPVKLAEKLGYFKQEGLNVQVKVFQAGPQALPALASGDLDVSLANYVSFYQAEAKKTIDAKVIADAYQGSPSAFVVLAKPSSGIKSAKDLAGKKVSVHQKGSVAELLLKATLQDNGVSPDSVSEVEVHFPDIPAALASSQIDAGVETEPYITQAEQQVGAQPAIKLITGSTADIPLSGYIATSKFAAENPKTIAAFQRAMIKAQKDAADRTMLAQVLPELTGVDKQSVSLLNLGVFPTSVDATRLQRVITLMKTYGGFTAPLQAKDLLVPTPSS